MLFYRDCVVLLCNTHKRHIVYSESEYNKKRHTVQSCRCVSFVFVMFVNSWMRIVERKRHFRAPHIQVMFIKKFILKIPDA